MLRPRSRESMVSGWSSSAQPPNSSSSDPLIPPKPLPSTLISMEIDDAGGNKSSAVASFPFRCMQKARTAFLDRAGDMASHVLYIAFSFTTMIVFHDWFCGIVLGCGCTWPWAGGAKYCNWHNPSGLKCPWCLASPRASIWTQRSSPLTMILLFVFLDSYRRNGKVSWAAQLGLPVVAFFFVEFWWTFFYSQVLSTGDGYPCFIWYKQGECTEYEESEGPSKVQQNS